MKMEKLHSGGFWLIVTVTVLMGLLDAVSFQQGDGKQVWAHNCDYANNDLWSEPSKGNECGGKCERTQRCTHFTWTSYRHGTCWLKHGSGNWRTQAKPKHNTVCGYINNGGVSGDHSGGVSGIKGTYWAPASDPGGCQLPSGNYAFTDAIALGQQSQLGPLVWKQGLCGQVLNVNCGHGTVQAVVASTCNLGSPSCGVDMIAKTWNKATNNQSPGVTNCQVSLSNTNPMNEGGPLCYHRPNTELSNAYYTAVGVINTGGKITSSATIRGVAGSRGNDGWFQFNSGGQPLFKPSSTVTFNYEDGSQSSFTLGQCQSGGQTQIFQ